MKKYFLFLFLLTISVIKVNSNPSKSDSLFNLLKTAKNDTNKVTILLGIADELNQENPIKSKVYAMQALKLAEDLKWNNGLGDAHYSIGLSCYVLGDFSDALNNWLKLLYRRELAKDNKGICSALGNIGVIYFQQGNFLKALEYYFRALKLSENLNDSNKVIANLGNIGMTYKNMGDYSNALHFHLRALKLARESNDTKFLTSNLGSLAGIYWRQDNFSKSLEYYKLVLALDQKNGNKKKVASWLSNIGNVYFEYSNKLSTGYVKDTLCSKALEYYKEAIKLSNELADKGNLAVIYGNMGCLYIELNRLEDACNYLTKSSAIADSTKSLSLTNDVTLYFSKYYEKKGDHAIALKYFKKYIIVKDSLFNESNKKYISELQIKYETAKKEKENKTLLHKTEIQSLEITKKRYFIIALISFVIMLFCVFFLIFRQNRLKFQKQSVLLEQKLLRIQMNPHFIFNSLTNIESFIYDNEPMEAGKYLSKISRLMRLVLENSRTEYISLEKEVETLNHYLSLEKLRLYDNMKFIIDVDNSIDPKIIMIPPMLAQPFIENAIQHGFRGLDYTGCITVQYCVEKTLLKVIITDNGIGIEQSQNRKDQYKKHSSMAMEITKERLSILSKLKKQKHFFEVVDLYNEQKVRKGTQVIFTIPLLFP